MPDDAGLFDLYRIHPGVQVTGGLGQHKWVPSATPTKPDQIDNVYLKMPGKWQDIMSPPATGAGQSMHQHQGRTLSSHLVGNRHTVNCNAALRNGCILYFDGHILHPYM
jgi:hypothetical protein